MTGTDCITSNHKNEQVTDMDPETLAGVLVGLIVGFAILAMGNWDRIREWIRNRS